MISKRVSILQSNYIPWRGYFDIMGLADEFIVYDSAQYTKNDWRNRNRIRTSQGEQWLTIPVITSGRFGQTIADAEIQPGDWADRHWKAIAQAYARAPFFGAYASAFDEVFKACRDMSRLSAVNRRLMETIAGYLGLTTTITDAAAYECSGDRNERLVSLCRAAGATDYLTGPSARNYLDLDLFARAAIRVGFIDYSRYRPYPQVHGGFVGEVSVLDLLFNTGEAARSHLQCGAAPAP